MKEYTIKFNEFGNWELNGNSEDFLFLHLQDIASENAICVDDAESESHILAILKSKGIKVNLVELDGSSCEW